MAFRKLLIKELKSIFPVFAIFSILIVLLHSFILYKSSVMGNDVILGLSVIFPLFILALIAIVMGYYQLHLEWKTNSIYLLLSLPIRGWKVLTAKLTAVFSIMIVTMIWILISFSILLLRVRLDDLRVNFDLSELVPIVLNVAVNSFWIYCLVVLFMIVILQFSFLCGQLVARFKWIVVFVTFFVSLWVFFRLSPIVSQGLLWTPDIFLQRLDGNSVYLHSGPFIVLVLAIVGFIGLSGFIFEKEVEV